MDKTAILALTGPALDEAVAAHVMRFSLSSDGLSYYRDDMPRHVWRVRDWRPRLDLNQCREAEAMLTAEQQYKYYRLVQSLLDEQARAADPNSCAGWFDILTADATTRCRALLLAVVAPE